MTLTLAEIKAHMVPYEGQVSHMYLDSVGRVTVGIGNMLPNLAAAQALPFVRKLDNVRATHDAIEADWNRVHEQRGVHSAVYYARHTQLELPEAEIDALYARRVDEFNRQLQGVFENFDAFPDAARLAVLDMAFNLGVGALNTSWPKFKTAILAENWIDAATHCVRPGARPVRNAGTQDLFRAAARASERH